MTKNFERFGYIAKVVSVENGSALLTIKNPIGKIVKQTEYKNLTGALQGWYHWCAKRNMQLKPREQDAVVIDINIPEPEEPALIINEPVHTIKESAPIICDKIANTMSLTAIIDFNFINSMNLSLTDWITSINERIKSGEYNHSEIVRIRLVPNN